jgi:chromosome segregation ATPase
MSDQTVEELRAALEKEREEHRYSKNAHSALGVLFGNVVRENENLKRAMNTAAQAHEETKAGLSRVQEELSFTTEALSTTEYQLDCAHFKTKRVTDTLDKTRETLARTQQALAATQAALTLAVEARDDAQAFQMTGFY